MIYTLFFIGINHLNAQYATSNFSSTSLMRDGLKAPGRMAVDTNDYIYATDAIQKNIVKYDGQGNYITTITTALTPLSIAINNKNQLFIGDEASGSIYKVSPNGSNTLFYEGTSMPNSMVFGLNNILYIVDSQLKKVIGLDVSGTVVKEFTYNTFTFPTGIAFDKQNNRIIVSEHGGVGEDVQTCGGGSMSWGTTGPLTTIYIFDIDGNLIKNFGCFGTKAGLFHRIQGISVGTCGNIYAVDPYLGRVNVFNENGVYVTAFGIQGDGIGQFNLPMDIVFTSDNRVFVSSMNKGAIDVFSITSTLPTATITSADQEICTGATAGVKVAFTGTAPWTFTYTLNGLNPQTVTAASSPYMLTVSEEGLYEITALTDGNSAIGKCFTGTTNVQISTTPPTATITTPTFSKCSNDNTGIKIQFTGIAPFTFTYTVNDLNPKEITTTENSYFLDTQESGLYQIISLSDACYNVTTIIENSIVTVSPLPVVEATASQTVICAGQEVTLTGSGALNYQWDNNVSNGVAFIPTQTATYTVTGTNEAGCAATASIEIIVNPLPVKATANKTVICAGQEVTLTGSGALNYQWDKNVSNGVAFIPTQTATYTVTGTNEAGCAATASIKIIVFPLPVVEATASQTVICAGQEVTLTGSGAPNYQWDNNVSNGVAFIPTQTATYTVTGTNEAGCAATASIEIIVNPIPMVEATASKTVIRDGQKVTLTGSGALNYQWDNNVSNGVAFIPTQTATYTVTGTNEAGCAATASIEIIVNSSSKVEATASKTVISEGQEVTLTGSGALNYQWDNNVSNGVAFKPTQTATYTVTGTDANGYSNTASIEIVVDQNYSTLAVDDYLNSDSKKYEDFIMLYPNPSNGVFTIKITAPNPIVSDISIVITSSLGQTIYTEVFNPFSAISYGGNIYKEIRLPYFTKGVYIVYVQADNFAGNEKLILKD